MSDLNRIYSLVKLEYSGRLLSCKDMYNNSKYKDRISKHLKDLGYRCPKELEYVLFFALVDIVVIVDSDNKFYFASFSKDKLYDLGKNNRILPKKPDVNLSKAWSLVETLSATKINKHLAGDKLAFLKLNRVPNTTSFYCTLSSMNPYPRLTDERVYTVDCIANYFNELMINKSINRYLINDKYICNISGVDNVFDCKLNLEGDLSSIYIWDISSITKYVGSDKLEPILSGVCKQGGTYFTLNRDILKQYYNDNFLRFESKGVRVRYCLDELSLSNSSKNVKYYIHKYKFGDYEDICSCKSTFELINLLKKYVRPVEYNDKYANVRVLAHPSTIITGHRSYYLKLDLSSDFEVVEDYESIMPKIYKIGIVTQQGYQVVKFRAYSFSDAITSSERQFNGKVVGLQLGDEICKGKHRVYEGLVNQSSLLSALQQGYRQNYDNYSKILRVIISNFTSNPVSDDMIKILFVNTLAKEVRDCRALTLQILGYHLEQFLNLVVTKSENSINNKIKRARGKL